MQRRAAVGVWLAAMLPALLAGCADYDKTYLEPTDPYGGGSENVVAVKPYEIDSIEPYADGQMVLGAREHRDVYLWMGRSDTVKLCEKWFHEVVSAQTGAVTVSAGDNGDVVLTPVGAADVSLVLVADNPLNNDTLACHVRGFGGSTWVTAVSEEVCPGVTTTFERVKRLEVDNARMYFVLQDSVSGGMFSDETLRYSFWAGVFSRDVRSGAPVPTVRAAYSWSDERQTLTVSDGDSTITFSCQLLYHHGRYLRLAMVSDETSKWAARFPDAGVRKVITAQYLDRTDLSE